MVDSHTAFSCSLVAPPPPFPMSPPSPYLDFTLGSPLGSYVSHVPLFLLPNPLPPLPFLLAPLYLSGFPLRS